MHTDSLVALCVRVLGSVNCFPMHLRKNATLSSPLATPQPHGALFSRALLLLLCWQPVPCVSVRLCSCMCMHVHGYECLCVRLMCKGDLCTMRWSTLKTDFLHVHYAPVCVCPCVCARVRKRIGALLGTNPHHAQRAMIAPPPNISTCVCVCVRDAQDTFNIGTNCEVIVRLISRTSVCVHGCVCVPRNPFNSAPTARFPFPFLLPLLQP